MKGYTDARGRSMGVFGASDKLTYGQLAAIVIRIANINPIQEGPLTSISAEGDWSESFIRAAEQRGWSAFQAPIDVRSYPDKATVLRALLDAAGIPFGTDPDAPFAVAVERGLTFDVKKRVLTRRETAMIISRLLENIDR